MRKATVIFLFQLLFLTRHCQAQGLLETENFILSLESYFRTDVVSLKNVVDLDSQNKDDSTTYLGIDYSFGIKSEFKDGGPVFYLKLERNGPFDYDAPLFVHNTLQTSSGQVQRYRNDELLPQVEEFWLDLPLPDKTRIKAGLFAYEVGNGFSLSGGYENYGANIYRESNDFSWKLHYCRPELVYKNHLGPRIHQDEEQGMVYNHNASNFFAADFKLNKEYSSLQPYVGVLVDYTSPGKRDNLFSAPIKKDYLGTLGFAWSLNKDKISFLLEMAHNFGMAESADENYKDITHAGYLIFTELNYRVDNFTPCFQFLLASGNRVTPEMAKDQATTLTSGKNRAFSYTSPLNNHLGDSISSSNSDARPIVAMGAGYGLNYGVPRPNTFSSTDFDNLIMSSLGFDWELTKKFSMGLYGYYMMSFARGAGVLNDEGRCLSRELGYEADIFLDYKINPHTLISFLGGYFIPGQYYKEKRDDTDGSLFSPFVRGDGDADPAYQLELVFEVKF